MNKIEENNIDNASKLKIFALYHRRESLFRTDAIEPLQTGCDNAKEDLGILKDNTGDNISYKNDKYAELTAHYWVWKNYLKANPNLEYVGFCHYRRFLDFTGDIVSDSAPFANAPIEKFQATFETNYSADTIYPIIKDYDVILPTKNVFLKNTIYDRYVKFHHKKNIDTLIAVIKETYPEMGEDIDSYLSGWEGYLCLNFLMKTNLFNEYMDFTFNILFKVDAITGWEEPKEYSDQKTPAYLMERFFNVWLRYKIRTQNLQILEKPGVLLAKEYTKKRIFPGIVLEKYIGFYRLTVLGIRITLRKKEVIGGVVYKWRNKVIFKKKL